MLAQGVAAACLSPPSRVASEAIRAGPGLLAERDVGYPLLLGIFVLGGGSLLVMARAMEARVTDALRGLPLDSP
jgi:hypothetical protein